MQGRKLAPVNARRSGKVPFRPVGERAQRESTPWNTERGGAASEKGRRQDGHPLSQKQQQQQPVFLSGDVCIDTCLAISPLTGPDLHHPDSWRAGRCTRSQSNSVENGPVDVLSARCSGTSSYPEWRDSRTSGFSEEYPRRPANGFSHNTDPGACLVQPAPGARTLAVIRSTAFPVDAVSVLSILGNLEVSWVLVFGDPWA